MKLVRRGIRCGESAAKACGQKTVRLARDTVRRRAALLAAGALCALALAAGAPPAAAQVVGGGIIGRPPGGGNSSPLFAVDTVGNREVAENTAAGTAIGPAFVAIDADGDQVSYRLGGPNGGSFTIGSNDGVLKTKAALDHEAKARYVVYVVASDGSLEFILSIAITVTDVDEPPLAPAGLTVAAVSWGTLRATWTAPGNAGRPAITDYDVQYRRGRSGAWSDHAHTGTATSADIGSLELGHDYQVRVRAENDEGEGPWTLPASGTALRTPYDPTGLTATKDGRLAIDLSWTAPVAAATRAAVTGYAIQWSADGSTGWTALATTAAGTTAHSHAGLSPGTARHYRVRATSSVGASAWSSVASATTDANVAPVFTDGATTTRSVAENTAAGQDVGAAVAATDAEGDEVSYALRGADAASFEIDGGSGQLKVRSALDHENEAGYTVTVGASDVYGGNASITVTITVTDVDEPPSAPAGLAVAALSEFTLRVTWMAPGDLGRPAVTDYDVQYRRGGSGAWSGHAHTGTATSADIGSLTPGSYQVRVRAQNDEGVGAWTQPASGTALAAPLAPAGLTATKDGRLAIDLSWTAPVAAATRAAVTGYAIQWSADGSTGWTALATTAAGTTAHQDTGLSPGTARRYRVRAASSVGSGAWSSVASATTDANVAPVFTDGATTTRSVAENTAAGQDVGAAVAATDAEGDEVSYALRGADAASFEIDGGSGQLKVRSVLDHEAKAGYTVTVGASDVYGGSASITVTITVTDVDEPPSAPAGLAVAALSEFTLRVTWMAPGDLGRPAVTGYDVQYRAVRGGAWSSHAHTGTVTSADIGNLTPSTGYLARVRAKNAEGNGAWTLPAAVTTAPAAVAPQQAAVALSVPWDWPLLPGGLSTGQSFRLMFITSDGRDATSALTASYNTHVQNAAARNRVLAASGLSAHFRAFVQPAETAHHLRPNTMTRSTDPGASAPIYWLSGPKVADGYADLYDGSWDSTDGGRPTYESGAALRSKIEVWTGSRADGTHWAGHRVGDDRAIVGLPRVAGKELGSGTDRAATERKGLYAISPVITVVSAPEAIRVRGANGVKMSVRGWSILVTWPDTGVTCGHLIEWAKQGESYRAANSHTMGAFAVHHTKIHVEPGTTYRVRVSELPTREGGSNTVLAEMTATTQGTAPGTPQRSPPQTPAPQTRAELTASVAQAPAEHRGKGRFTVLIAFSEAVAGRAKDAAATMRVTGGTLARAERVDRRADLWALRVYPAGHEAVTLTLPATADCAAPGAVCAADRRRLESPLTVTVKGPPALSVADARAREGTDASIDFGVTLSRAASGEVTVRYATRDGTAKKGEDYRKAKGTLTFAAGETAKTVTVALLDDAKDEGEETFTLVLKSAQGAAIADAEAVGVIENRDPLPQAWLARVGRTVASQAVEAVAGRLDGGGVGHLTVGGVRIDPVAREAGNAVARGEKSTASAPTITASAPTITEREVLLGSAFHLASEGEAGGPAFSAWGRVAHGGFDGQEDAVELDGSVTTAFLGADVAGGRWLAGAAVSYSKGAGRFALSGAAADAAFGRGTVESTLTSVLPYARMDFGERVSAWGLAGLGAGELTLTERSAGERRSHTAALTMMLGAVGARGTLVPAPVGGGLALALGADAFWVRTESAETGGMRGAQADATRLRLVLDASHAFALGAGALTPSLEVGVRHDGGDAETGAGVEVGGALGYAVPGVTAEVRGRGLLAIETGSIREWGASGSLRIEPGAAGRGLSLTVAPAVGVAASGTERLWSAADARAFAPRRTFAAEGRLDAEVGYGLAVPAGLGTATPYAGLGLADGERAWRAGARWQAPAPGLSVDFGGTWRAAAGDDTRSWRAGVRWQVAPAASLDLDGTRTESATGAEHGLTLRGSVRW